MDLLFVLYLVGFVLTTWYALRLPSTPPGYLNRLKEKGYSRVQFAEDRKSAHRSKTPSDVAVAVVCGVFFPWYWTAILIGGLLYVVGVYSGALERAVSHVERVDPGEREETIQELEEETERLRREQDS